MQQHEHRLVSLEPQNLTAPHPTGTLALQLFVHPPSAALDLHNHSYLSAFPVTFPLFCFPHTYKTLFASVSAGKRVNAGRFATTQQMLL